MNAIKYAADATRPRRKDRT